MHHLIYISVLLLAIAATFIITLSHGHEHSVGCLFTTGQDFCDWQLKMEVPKKLTENDLFELLVSLFSLILAVIAIVGVGIYYLINKELERKYSQKLDESEVIILILAPVWTLVEISMQYFLEYFDCLSEFHNNGTLGKRKTRETLAKIDAALNALEKAENNISLEVIDKEKFLRENPRYLSIYKQIHNGILYNEVAKLVLKNEKISSSTASSYIDRCDYLENLLKNENYKTKPNSSDDWYNMYETIAYCKIYLGILSENDALENQGKKLVEDLWSGRKLVSFGKKPPQDWCDSIKLEYTQGHAKINFGG